MTNVSSGKFTVDDTWAFIDTNLEKANFYIAVTRPQISGAPTRAPRLREGHVATYFY
jgi:hypothetical protein